MVVGLVAGMVVGKIQQPWALLLTDNQLLVFLYILYRGIKKYFYMPFIYIRKTLSCRGWLPDLVAGGGANLTYQEIGAVAKTSEKVPASWSTEDKICCHCLRGLYARYTDRCIDRKILIEEAAAIKDLHTQLCYWHTLYRAAYAQYQESIRQAGHLRAEILKGLESGTGADKLLLLAMECIGRITGEMRTYEIVRDKLAPDAKMQE